MNTSLKVIANVPFPLHIKEFRRENFLDIVRHTIKYEYTFKKDEGYEVVGKAFYDYDSLSQ